jgi:P27 family predicted phage terminase small subunit
MKTGRKKEPTAIKILKGSNKRYIPENEPKALPLEGDIPAPDWMGEATKIEFNRLFEQLKNNKILTQNDVLSFLKMFEHLELSNQAFEQIQKDGILTKDERGLPRKNPLLQVYRENSLAYLRYAGEFGLTPSSRGNLSIPDYNIEDDDPMEKLLTRKR